MTQTWTSNELLTAQKFNRRRRLVATKNGKQSYSGTTTDRDDADLVLLLPDFPATYVVRANFGVTGATASDITLSWVAEGEQFIWRTQQAIESAATSASDANLICRELTVAGWGAGTVTTPVSVVREKLIVVTDDQPCHLNLAWSQNISNAVWTSVHDYSWVSARRIA